MQKTKTHWEPYKNGFLLVVEHIEETECEKKARQEYKKSKQRCEDEDIESYCDIQ